MHDRPVGAVGLLPGAAAEPRAAALSRCRCSFSVGCLQLLFDLSMQQQEQQEQQEQQQEQQVRPGDAQLVQLIAAEIERDGGIALVSRLISYNPAIRKLLSGRRLLPFLQRHKDAFELLCSDSPPRAELGGEMAARGATYRVRMVAGWTPTALQAGQGHPGSRKRPEPEQEVAGDGSAGGKLHQCRGCRATFRSRTALFKHLRDSQNSESQPAGTTWQCPAVAATAAAAETMAAAGGSARATVRRHVETKESKALQQAIVFALRRRLLRIGRRDTQQQADPAGGLPQDISAASAPSEYAFGEDYAPLSWLATSKKAKVQRSLINYIRSLPMTDESSLQTAGTGQGQREQQHSRQGSEVQSRELARTAGLELLSDAWWTEAVEILRQFLQQENRKKLFDITMQEHSHTGSCVAAVRLTEAGLEPLPTSTTVSSGEEWDPVWSRVLALLEGQRSVQGGMSAGQGDHFLGRLASDVGTKRYALPCRLRMHTQEKIFSTQLLDESLL